MIQGLAKTCASGSSNITEKWLFHFSPCFAAARGSYEWMLGRFMNVYACAGGEEELVYACERSAAKKQGAIAMRIPP